MTTLKSYLPKIELKYKRGETKKVTIESSGDVFEIAKELFNTDTVEINEEVIILYLNRANTTLGWIRHTSGGSVSSIIDVKLILVAAINCNAQAIIMLHNHPSGNLTPSAQDISMAIKLKNASTLIDVSLLDSIIVTGELNKFYSLADNGDM